MNRSRDNHPILLIIESIPIYLIQMREKYTFIGHIMNVCTEPLSSQINVTYLVAAVRLSSHINIHVSKLQFTLYLKSDNFLRFASFSLLIRRSDVAQFKVSVPINLFIVRPLFTPTIWHWYMYIPSQLRSSTQCRESLDLPLADTSSHDERLDYFLR